MAPDWDTAAVGVLNQMAVNGNQALQGSATSYYPLGALGSFSVQQASTGSCLFALPLPFGPETTNLAVTATTVDGNEVRIPEDPTTGWTFTDTTLTSLELNGSACQSQMAGSYTGINIVYQCRQLDPLGHQRSRPAGR